jgi:cyclic beta-1,2-glucan synthetase
MTKARLRRQIPDAGAEALAMLDPSRGVIEAPIRGEIFSAARFGQHGRSLGEAQLARVRAPRSAAFFPRLHQNIRVLREAQHYIGLQERIGHHVSPAGEWLLDNFHLVVAQIKEIHDGLPRRYFRDLPVLVDAHLAGLPRVYGVAWAFVAHTDSAFDDDLLVEFLNAYQQTSELNLGELWALPTTLRVVLVENLRRLSERVAADKAARELANLWCDRLEREEGGHSPEESGVDAQGMFDLMRARRVGTVFALQVMQRLHSDSGSRSASSLHGREVIREALARALPDPAGAQAQQQTEEAADNLSVSNAINSLRLLGDADWRALIARTSMMMQLMQASPTFRAERDDTQDATLHAIERLARRSGRSELSVAEMLLELMRVPPGSDALDPAAPVESPSFWLRGSGCRVLRQALGMGPVTLPVLSDLRSRLAVPAYLTAVFGSSLLLTVWFVSRYAAAAPASWWAVLALLALLPASEAVIAVFNRLISEWVPPRRLPRLALSDGIPAAQRVLVVVPAMLSAPGSARALARQLERHHLANREAHAQFAMLTDFSDADSAQCAGDADRLAEAIAAIDRLESLYPPDRHDGTPAPRRFLLLHRERCWSETEQRWIGWERKRGKLEQLIDLLAGGSAKHFIDMGERSQPARDTPFVVTLDSDTLLPAGSLRELVGVAAHPLNRPHVDAARGCVVAGYAVLQPRIVTPIPSPEHATPFHWLFAGRCGVDPYSAATSELYQDLFEEGTFTGKGLLHVKAMQAVLSGRLPEGQVLSHDLIEGSIARCGGVSDITLIEDAPMHADVAASRVHRWTRGDWQLWPLLLRGRRFQLSPINRWKLIDNLRRSLVAPASVLLLLISLGGNLLSPWAALALMGAAFGGGPLLGALAGLAPARDDVALRHFYHQALADVARAFGGLLWNLALLLRNAVHLCDAIVRALWRTLVSRRLLLQWTTAADAQGAARRSLRGLWRAHWPVSLLAVCVLAVLWWLDTPSPLLALAVCALWAGTPLWIAWASRPRPDRHHHALAAGDRAYLHGVARHTWRLFERHVGPASNYLPPDNVQTVPYTMVAQRTSPTNIGLYLLAAACAQRFGWISTLELLTRCERTLATLAGLERHRGHFLNWYDTQTLRPLTPAYVSAVDSGNLCGHLIALAGACDELVSASPAGAELEFAATERLAVLAARCRGLALEAEFGFLYDRRRRLFHIGYLIVEQLLDKSYYDLLASEARLASLWAIAKGDVPVSHWAALGRPFFATGKEAGLRSWSGSMFEYLMPSLVLDEPPGSALASAAHAAVREHIAFGRMHGVPWGLSESAYAASDHTLAYQYSPQGVPRLALRRTPADDIVVAPYATALAAMFDPAAATDNLRRFEDLDARRDMGFAEALDYAADRQTGGSSFTVVSTFMAHHQGMTIVALANVLLGGAPRRWCMSDARIDAVSPLLQERVPREVSRLLAPPPAPTRTDRRDALPGATRALVPGASALQPTHLLSNGRYSVALRANGAGWSRFGAADVSRWRDDALRDAWGTFFYLRRDPLAAPVSITQHPAADRAADYNATFHSDRVCFDAQWPDLRTRCTVWVSPEDDIELRSVELWNTSSQAMDIELMSMFEVSLSDCRADEMHPAFAKLFVQADWDAATRALYFVRKPRLPTEDGVHAVHFIAHGDVHLGEVRPQTDRARWLGRHRDAAHPRASYDAPTAEAGHCVTGLDPLASLSMRLKLPAHGMTHVTVGTAAAANRAELELLVDRYRQTSMVERSSLMSGTFASIRLREMRVHADDRIAIQILATALTLLVSRPGASAGDAPAPAGHDRRTLWRLGISGDRPLVVVSAGTVQGVRMVRSLMQALRWWSWGGLACDLVILNGEPRSYLMPLQIELAALRDRHVAEAVATAPTRACGLYLLHADDVSLVERTTLTALARVRLHADGRPLSHHVQELVEWHDAALEARAARSVTPFAPPRRSQTGTPPQGDFDGRSGAFRFTVSDAHRTARPWINVLANPRFGTQVSEAGAAYSWAGNSRLNQLTGWSNDPVGDAGGEAFHLQDVRTLDIWNVGAGAGCADVPYTVEHGQGMTTIRHRRGDVEVQAIWCVDADSAVRQVRIVLTNRGTRMLRLRVIGVFEWVMGALRVDRQSVRTALQPLPLPGAAASKIEVLLATQCDGHAGFGGSTAFVALRREGAADALIEDWTCDRRELFDIDGRAVLPDRLGAHAGAAADPCAALSAGLNLAPSETVGHVFLLGHADTPEAARALARDAVDRSAVQRERSVSARWDALLDVVTVSTPDPLFDVLVNRWLPYQTVACRLWARAGFYQAGGAFGFRDQLQDAMAMCVSAPALLRAQLLLSASRQFAEGDVQHWWHAPTGAGVRTRCSDDRLWLPHAAAHYIEVTGDVGVFDEMIPFIEGDAIPDGAEDAYYVPRIGTQHVSLYEHCARAIDCSLAVGAHGLPLMGTGDWNDGMNRVGHEGRGESVWLGWFLCQTVTRFALLAHAEGETTRAERWQLAAAGLRDALRSEAWDGHWFMRAFFDDGTPLGSQRNEECRIDLIAQAWGVLSGIATPAQQQASMAAVGALLTDEPNGLVRLLDPPLQHAVPDAGYIQAYPPGVRENGGHYAHAAVWALMAQAEIGDNEGAWRTFTGLSPAHRSAHPGRRQAYELEPYVMAGDIYTQPPYVGRGGWSWYTGSAAWMHRAAIESICGLRVRHGKLCVLPRLPGHWPQVTLTVRRDGRRHEVTVCADWAVQDITQAQASGAIRLGIGDWLDLADAGDDSRHLVVATAVPAEQHRLLAGGVPA